MSGREANLVQVSEARASWSGACHHEDELIWLARLELQSTGGSVDLLAPNNHDTVIYWRPKITFCLLYLKHIGIIVSNNRYVRCVS